MYFRPFIGAIYPFITPSTSGFRCSSCGWLWSALLSLECPGVFWLLPFKRVSPPRIPPMYQKGLIGKWYRFSDMEPLKPIKWNMLSTLWLPNGSFAASPLPPVKNSTWNQSAISSPANGKGFGSYLSPNPAEVIFFLDQWRSGSNILQTPWHCHPWTGTPWLCYMGIHGNAPPNGTRTLETRSVPWDE